MSDDFGLPEEVRIAYEALRRLPDGRIIGVHRLLYHYTLQVDIDWCGYHERYCYATLDGAMKALREWDGAGDPEGWHRHPESGRRRDPETGREWVAP